MRRGDKNLQSVARDSEILGRWLDQFSGEAGGALFRVQVGSGEYAFDRVLNEISAYYLLGVEPGDEDRDGRTHEIKVKTTQKNVIIRGRRWVMVPKRGGGRDAFGGPPSESPASNEKPAPPPRRVVPADVQAMAEAFDRGEPDFQRGLARHAGSRDPAPQLPRIGCAVAGRAADERRCSRSNSRLPRSGATTGTRVTKADGCSPSTTCACGSPEGLTPSSVRGCGPKWRRSKACSWPDSAMLFVPRAVERCPREGRLHLAHAIISEQQWLRGTAGAERGDQHPRPLPGRDQVSGDRRGSPDAGGVVSVAGSASSMRRWRSSTLVRPAAPIRTCSI